MSYKAIELQGIVRNLPDNTVIDGAAQELINLRPRDGALRPVGTKTFIVSIPHDVRYIHAITDETKVFISTNNSFISYWVEHLGTLGSEVITTIPSALDMNFSSLYKALIVSNNNLLTKHLFLFDINTSTYRIFDTLVPDMPYVSLQSVVKSEDDETVTENFDVDPDEFNTPEKIATRANDGLEALASVLLVKKQKKGYLVGRYLVRFAWELFDGSIVMHSTPQIITVSLLDCKSNTLEIDPPPAIFMTSSARFTGYKMQYKVNLEGSDLVDLVTKWDGIVKSLNIYLTDNKGVIDFLDSDTSSWVNALDKVTITDADNQEWINNCSLYYEFQKIPLKEMLLAGIYKDVIVKDIELLNTNKTMSVNTFACHTIFGRRLFAYNERIWYGNILNTLYAGFPLKGFLQPCLAPEVWTAYHIGMIFELATIDGTKIVFSGWQEFTHYLAGSGPNHFSFIWKDAFGYPDSRAKYCTWYIKDPSGNIRKLYKFTLSQVLNMNFSYSYGYEQLIIAEGFPGFDGEFTDFAVEALPAIDNTYWDYNRVQATELDNPFYFPAINSYRIGLGSILGMASNVLALSQGQFGQFPIYVFSTEGIWTMNIGSGAMLINTITPLSREVCNNPMSILQIDGGVVFGTAHGLLVVAGAQVFEISQAAEGNYLGRISGTLNYEAIANNPDLYLIHDYLCSVGFLDYLANAAIGYDYILKEIIVSNSSYAYSWVYSLQSKAWFKISEVFDTFVTDFFRNSSSGEAITADRTDITADSEELTADAITVPAALLSGSPLMFGYRDLSIAFESRLGRLYNYPVITDPRNIAPAGWHIPTIAEVAQMLVDMGGAELAGQYIKEMGVRWWSNPVQIEDYVGLAFRGNGMRLGTTGAFQSIRIIGSFWVSDGDEFAGTGYLIHAGDIAVGTQTNTKNGLGIRYIKDDTTYCDEMTGNDGKVYPVIQIGTRFWTAANSCETKFRNGDLIPEVTGNSAWAALSTGAFCHYSNDVANSEQSVYDGYTRHDMTDEDFSELVSVHLETRPMKLSPVKYKKINRLLIEGFINSNTAESLVFPFSVNLFGSTDGANWFLLNNGSTFSSKTPLLIKRSTHSCRLFILVIGGKVDEEAYFTHLEADFEDRYGNKLR